MAVRKSRQDRVLCLELVPVCFPTCLFIPVSSTDEWLSSTHRAHKQSYWSSQAVVNCKGYIYLLNISSYTIPSNMRVNSLCAWCLQSRSRMWGSCAPFVRHHRLINQPRTVPAGYATTVPDIVCRIDVNIIQCRGIYTPESSSISARWLSSGVSPPLPKAVDRLVSLPAFSARGVGADVRRNDPGVLTRCYLE